MKSKKKFIKYPKNFVSISHENAKDRIFIIMLNNFDGIELIQNKNNMEYQTPPITNPAPKRTYIIDLIFKDHVNRRYYFFEVDGGYHTEKKDKKKTQFILDFFDVIRSRKFIHKDFDYTFQYHLFRFNIDTLIGKFHYSDGKIIKGIKHIIDNNAVFKKFT